jgi:eukaryotic-like serine/threonine-protein kinase
VQTRTLNDRYRLDEVVGEGGMAVVYRGYDLVLNRDVAVKLLRDQYGSDDNFLARFDREAQSAARLSHPNIVNVYDVGEDQGVRYIVMEHVEGPNLKDLIRRQGPFTIEGAAFVIRQIADGLDYAHARGLVHRDIKPHNVLVDENGNVKVVDFGIAKGISDSHLTEAGTGMGTVHYVSPEQARGEAATPLSDVYSTGVVLYEMLTKSVPFDADSPVGVAMQHVTAVPPPPSELNPNLPPDIDDLIYTALAKDPADRYASAGDLATALESLAKGESLAASTRVMGAGAAPTAVGPARLPRRRASARGGRSGVPPRAGNFRDDVGCVTWLIGSAILIGLIGLVALAFRLGDFGLFEPTVGQVDDATPTEEVGQTPSPSPAVDSTPTPEPTPGETPTPEASPTPEAEMVSVPEFEGSTLRQARSLAGDLELVEEEVFSDDVEEGLIVSQDPAAGSLVEVGSEVIVRVSLGPETVTIPELANTGRSDAINELEELGLSVDEAWEPNTNVPEGVVIRTEPSGEVDAGATVTIVISRGDVVQMPNIFRTPYQQAINQLEQAGLQVGSVGAQDCDYIRSQDPNFNCETFPDGHIVSATLGWNQWVPRNSTVHIAYYDAGQPADDDDDDDDD